MTSPKSTPPQVRWCWQDVWMLLDVSSRRALATALGISVQAVWNLEHVQHAHCPTALLRKLASVARKHGMIDGSKPPSATELVRLWLGQQRERRAVAAAQRGT